MLSSFRVEWFKTFSSLDIPDLAPITAISGRNNCGKTSLLEAIFLFFDRTNPQMLLRSMGWRGFAKLEGTPDFLFGHAFHDYDLEHPIVLEATYNGKRRTLRLSYVPHERRAVPLEAAQELGSSSGDRYGKDSGASSDSVEMSLLDADTGQELEHGRVYIDSSELKLSGNMSRVDLGNAKYQGLRVRSSAGEDARLFGVLDIQHDSARLIEFMRQFFPDVRSLTSVPVGAQGMIYADVGLPKKIPLPALGDGAARLVSYYLAAFNVDPGGILLLDEVGSGIHHSQLPKLWEGLAQLVDYFRCQIIATTHSYECLQAATCLGERLYGDKFRYIRLDQERNSREVQVVGYSFEEFLAAVEHGLEFR